MTPHGLEPEWTTLRASADISLITQARSKYVDLADYDDVVLYLEVREADGSAQISWQTSPTADDGSFVTLLDGIDLASLVGAGPRVDRFLAGYSSPPLARYLRWQLTGNADGSWGACFRVTLGGHAPGN